MGDAGRKYAVEHYSIEAQTPKLAAALKAAISSTDYADSTKESV
jgi:hypothetical protein